MSLQPSKIHSGSISTEELQQPQTQLEKTLYRAIFEENVVEKAKLIRSLPEAERHELHRAYWEECEKPDTPFFGARIESEEEDPKKIQATLQSFYKTCLAAENLWDFCQKAQRRIPGLETLLASEEVTKNQSILQRASALKTFFVMQQFTPLKPLEKIRKPPPFWISDPSREPPIPGLNPQHILASLPIIDHPEPSCLKLDLSDLKISTLPRTLVHFTDLRILDLRNNAFKMFPSVLTLLINITSLDLSGNAIEEIRVPANAFQTLTHLELSENPVRYISKELSKNKDLVISLSPFFFCFPDVNRKALQKLPERFPLGNLQVASCESLSEAQFFENGMEESLEQMSRNMEHFDSNRSFKELVEGDSDGVSERVLQKTFVSYLKTLNKQERAAFCGSLMEMTNLDLDKLFIGNTLTPNEEEFANIEISPKILSSIFNFIRVRWRDQANEFVLISRL